MIIFKELNTCGSAQFVFLPTVKLNDLSINEKYKITKFRWAKTQFGNRIVVELCEECQVFLPPRFATQLEQVTAEQLNEIVRDNILLIYRGNKQVGVHKIPTIEFE